MKTLQKITFYQNRRDEIPNQKLAAELAHQEDTHGIAEIAANIANKNNRMALGAMIGLATISKLNSKEIWERIAEVVKATDKGSLISFVWGVKTLAQVASENMLPAITGKNKGAFIRITEARKPEMTGSQQARLRKVFKKMEAAFVNVVVASLFPNRLRTYLHFQGGCLDTTRPPIVRCRAATRPVF